MKNNTLSLIESTAMYGDIEIEQLKSMLEVSDTKNI